MGEETIETRCVGQLSNGNKEYPPDISKPPYCEICKKDDKNRECPHYHTVKFHIINYEID